MYPWVHSVVGDIRDPITVYNAMAGKDIVVHMAAVKEIPTSEVNSVDTFQINVEGSMNVASAAIQHGIEHVIGISTDKVCHPANAYGATKYLMEKAFQEYSRLGLPTHFHLVRYGNVLESSASVLEAWKRAAANGEPIKVTDPDMTRFWISPAQAVDLVEACIRLSSGMILIPKMKALSIGKLAEYTVGDVEFERIPLRPGEKIHETLLTVEETFYASESGEYFFLRPTTCPREDVGIEVYSSDIAPEMSKEELEALLDG
jgi:UDP-N-acetylglucosamine 4,6-dehydratase